MLRQQQQSPADDHWQLLEKHSGSVSIATGQPACSSRALFHSLQPGTPPTNVPRPFASCATQQSWKLKASRLSGLSCYSHNKVPTTMWGWTVNSVQQGNLKLPKPVLGTGSPSPPPFPALLAAARGESAARKNKTGLDKHETKLHVSQDSSQGG